MMVRRVVTRHVSQPREVLRREIPVCKQPVRIDWNEIDVSGSCFVLGGRLLEGAHAEVHWRHRDNGATAGWGNLFGQRPIPTLGSGIF